MSVPDSIITLNVGGEKFSTSRHTLTWIPDSFFSSLLSGRISTVKDDSGAIFIDRDPKLFNVILNYLRSKQVDLKDVSLTALKHEAQYYGLSPLLKRLTLCDELEQSACGDVLFHGYLPPPVLPLPDGTTSLCGTLPRGADAASRQPGHSRNISEPPTLPSRQNGANHAPVPRPLPTMEAKFQVPALLESPR